MNLESLKSLFKDRIFRIPDYQRGYAWQHDQLIDFWDDIVNLKNDQKHYTGLLALRELNNGDLKKQKDIEWLLDIGYKAYHVIDGQQRLTTALILINEIADFVASLEENKEKSIYQVHVGYESLFDIKSNYIYRKKPPKYFIDTFLFGYEDDNPSSMYLEHEIFGKPDSGTLVETYYTKRLLYAKKFFISKLEESFRQNGLAFIEIIFKKLTHKLMFNLYVIDNMDEAYVIFETMNNRGKKLSNLELLKNRMIYLTTLYHEDLLESGDKEKLRKNTNDAWKEVYFQLGRNKNSPLSDDEYLKAHWITFYQYTRKTGDDYIDFLLEKFSSSNISDEPFFDVLQDFSDEIIDSEDNQIGEYRLIKEPNRGKSDRKLIPEEINEYVNSLRGLVEYWYYTFYPDECSHLNDAEKLQVKRLNRIGIGYFRPLVMVILSKTKINCEERIKVLSEIERFIFLLFRVGGFNVSYKINEFFAYARQLYIDSESINSITERLKTTIEKDTSTAISYFTERVKRWYKQGDGYYGWYGLKYFLFEYEYMLSEISEIDKVDWSLISKQEKDKVSIEHILPQTPSKSYWANLFKHYNDTEIKILSSSLGNLILLSQSINSSLQNDSFDNKVYAKNSSRRGYYNGSNSEIEVAQEKVWNAQAIRRKGMKYLNFMENRWQIQLTDQQKIDLLQLDFVSQERENQSEIQDSDEVARFSVDPNVDSDELSYYDMRFNYWKGFVDWCHKNNRLDVGGRKPSSENWYDVNNDSKDYHIFFQVLKAGNIRTGIYVYTPEFFEKLKSNKRDIEREYGSALEWDSSRKTSYEKRIIHTIEVDIYDDSKYHEYYEWYLKQYDKLVNSLVNFGKR